MTMVDSNLQREQITPSEKAYAYKMKYDAVKKKAGRKNIIIVLHSTLAPKVKVLFFYRKRRNEMSYKLVIAEKPSVAQSIAKVIGADKREDGYLEGKKKKSE